MFCTNCGKENKDGAKFCSSCGKQLVSNVVAAPTQAKTPKATPSSTPVTPASPVAPVTPAAKPVATPKKKKLIVLFAIIIAVLAGGLIWYITSKDDSSSDLKKHSSSSKYKDDADDDNKFDKDDADDDADDDDSDYNKHEHLSGNEDEKGKEEKIKEKRAEALSKYFGTYTLEKVNSKLGIDPPNLFKFWKVGFVTADYKAGVYANDYTSDLDIQTSGSKEYIVKTAQNPCETDFRFYVKGSTMYLEVVNDGQWIKWAEYSFEPKQ